MAANYVQLTDTIETVLQNALGDDITVTQDGANMTTEMCPMVIIDFESFERIPTFIGRPQFGGSYVEKVRVTLDCWAFSGQSALDAGAQRDALVSSVIQAVENSPELLGIVLIFQCLRGEGMTGQAGGIHSGMRLFCEGEMIT